MSSYRESQSHASQVIRELKHKTAAGYLRPAMRPGCHSCVHAKPETANSRIAQAGAIERGKLEPLLRRSLAQLRKWAEWYGNADHTARGQLPLPARGRC